MGRPRFPTQGPPTHQVVELSVIPMTVRPLCLGTLLPLKPHGGLVRAARVSWQVPQPWSRWQALMITEQTTPIHPGSSPRLIRH